MSISHIARRDFLADLSRGAAAGGLAFQLPWLVALAGCAREEQRFVTLTPAEARTMRAFAAQIIPSDDGIPGADEAGAVYFVDRALGLPAFAEKFPLVRGGLADLDQRAWSLGGRGWGGFAALSVSNQIAVMRAVEHEPFFAAARALVVIGTFADPSYDGNRNGAGWEMIGIEHRGSYAAPYGWYDARVEDGLSAA